jgi:hypothetical protein
MIAQNANHIANTLLIPIPKYLLFKLSPGFWSCSFIFNFYLCICVSWIFKQMERIHCRNENKTSKARGTPPPPHTAMANNTVIFIVWARTCNRLSRISCFKDSLFLLSTILCFSGMESSRLMASHLSKQHCSGSNFKSSWHPWNRWYDALVGPFFKEETRTLCHLLLTRS